MAKKPETQARVGRPNVVKGEESTKLGPFAVSTSTAEWFRDIAVRLGCSQGDCFRQALHAYKRTVTRRLGRTP